MVEDNTEYKSQYIDMDLAMHRISNGWDNSPRVRRLQKSLDSQEEFEFTMSNMAIKDDLYETTMEVAPADELFFRGQLLPLQHDPRLQLVQTLTCIKGEGVVVKEKFFATYQEEILGSKCAHEEEIPMKHAYEEGLPTACANEEGFPVQCAYQEGFPTKYVNEEGFSTGFCVQEGATLIKSCRSDGVFDAFKNDSRSSSFRSQQSSYWGSGEKDSRDSSSSSRCSNGSSQDSCFHGSERKAPHHTMVMAHATTNASANTAFSTVKKANGEANHHHNHGKPPLPSSKLKKWSWKTLFSGLRKASKIWVDDRGDDQGQITSLGEINKQKRSVFNFKLPASGQADRSMGLDVYEGESSSSNYFVGSGEMKKGRQQASSSRSVVLANDDYEGQLGTKYYVGSGGARGSDYYEGSGGRKEKAKMGMAWNARESYWQRCVNKVKRPLYGKLSINHKLHNNNINEDMNGFNMKAKSLSTTPLAKSPARRADNVNHNPDYGYMHGGPSSSKYMNVGFASCPASMRSSPHHSGVLAVINKAPPASSLHDLHTAIQGAIAHCKQSQTAKPS